MPTCNRVVRLLSVTVTCVLTAGLSGAQEVIFYAPHGGPPVAVDLSEPGRFSKSAIPTKVVKGTNLTFNVTYEDVDLNNGIGFDHPSQGAVRQATLDAVLVYVDSVLKATSGATIDVLVEASQTDGSGFLATAGTLFFTSTGYTNGFAFQHITTGVDPDLGSADIFIEVDFGFNWHSNHTTLPGPGQFDLFTVLLHEVTHGLGFLSLSDAVGESRISDSNPGTYSVWDQLMRFNVSTNVWNSATTVLEVATSAFTSDNLSFAGTNAVAAFGSQPPVYAPATFASGSSLSHYRTGSVNSVMEHAIPAGVAEREYFDVDVAALIDIGYVNASVTPVAQFSMSSFTVSENAGMATITVNLSQATGSNESVMFATSAGSAVPNVDYTDVSGTLNFGPSDTSMTFDVPVFDDNDPGPTVTVNLTLSDPSSGIALGALSTATLNITDDDNPAVGVDVVSQTGHGFIEEGKTLTLDVVFSGVTPPVTYQWEFEGTPIANGGDVSGADTTTLTITNVDSSRTGTYRLRGTDSSKGVFLSDPLFVQVVGVGALPAAGLLGLGLLSGALAALGAAHVRRKKR